MKRLFLSMAMSFVTIAGFSQLQVTTNKDGNYVAIQDTVLNPTGKVFIDAKGETHPVYKNKTNRLFIIRISKTGKKYNQYLAIKND